jgi:hypothetical protein
MAKGAYHYFGKSKELSYIWMEAEAKMKLDNVSKYFRKFGFLKDHNLWAFENCLISGKDVIYENEDGELICDGIKYFSDEVDIYSKDKPVLSKEHIQREYIDLIISNFWQMWDASHSDKTTRTFSTFQGFMVLGFIVASIYRPEIMKKYRLFPFLLCYGPPGCGKSEALILLMNCFGYTRGGEPWEGVPPVGMAEAVEQLTCIPYWMDEFSNDNKKSRQHLMKLKLLKSCYNGMSSGKGSLSGRRQSKEVNAPIIISGEDKIQEPAVLRRGIILRKGMPSSFGTQAFYFLKNQGVNLSKLVIYLITSKTKEKEKELFTNIEELCKQIKYYSGRKNIKIDEGSIINYSILAASFFVLDFEFNQEKFIQWLVDEVIEGVKTKEKEDIVYRFFKNIDLIFSDLTSVVQFDGIFVYLRFSYIYSEWLKENQKKGNVENYISEDGLREYLKKDQSGFWVEKSVRKRFNGHQANAIVLDRRKMPDNLASFIALWAESLGEDLLENEKTIYPEA